LREYWGLIRTQVRDAIAEDPRIAKEMMDLLKGLEKGLTTDELNKLDFSEINEQLVNKMIF